MVNNTVRTRVEQDFFRRPLIFCLVFYVAGLWLTRDLYPVSPSSFAGAIAALFLSSLVLSAWRRDSTYLILCVFLGFGALRISTLTHERAAAQGIGSALAAIDLPRHFQGTVAEADDGEELPYQRVVMRDVSITSGAAKIRLPGKSLLYIANGESTAAVTQFSIGDEVRGVAMFELPHGFRNFHLPDKAGQLAEKSIYFTAHVSSPDLASLVSGSSAVTDSALQLLYTFRKWASAQLSSNMPRHEGRLIGSMLFNDRRLLSDDDQWALRNSGTMHMFAVSGLHVGILAFVLFVVLRVFRAPLRWCGTLAVGLLFIYAAMLAFIPPVTRAFLMFAAYAAGTWLKREVDKISAFAFGIAMILLLDPLALWQASFQLSCAGVLGIVVFLPLFDLWIPTTEWKRLDSYFKRAVAFFGDALKVSLSATLAVFPFQLHYFMQFNLLSPVANLLEACLAAPALSFALLTIALAPVGFLAAATGAATGLVMKMILWIAAAAASQEWAIIHTPQLPGFMVAVYYLALFSGYYMVRRDTPEFLPKSAARLLIHGSAGVVLITIFCAFSLLPHPLRIWFLDVGQGDSTLLEMPDGKTILIDCGNVMPDLGKMVVEPELRAMGIRPLGNLLATHSDADHIGGMPYLLSTYPVSNFFHASNWIADNDLVQQINASAVSRHIITSELREGMQVSLGPDLLLEALNPDEATAQTSGLKANDHSIVLRLTYRRFRAMFMADAEARLEKRLCDEKKLLPCDVLKVGHHGSHTSSTPDFIAQVAPRVAVISCGLKNRFGHPHPDVMKTLIASNAKIYRTDLDGAIEVETNGDGFTVLSACGTCGGQ